MFNQCVHKNAEMTREYRDCFVGKIISNLTTCALDKCLEDTRQFRRHVKLAGGVPAHFVTHEGKKLPIRLAALAHSSSTRFSFSAASRRCVTR